MIERSNRVGSLLAAALMSILTYAVAAANKPMAPGTLCIGSKCNSNSQPANASGGFKWHPGHYVWLDPHTSLASQFAVIDSLANESTVQGVQVLLYWSQLEGSTAGDYSQGFALVDSYLAKLASLKTPKRLMLGVNERSFAAPPPAGTSCADAASNVLPSYLAAMGGCALASPGAAGSLAVVAKFWEAPVMDRLIALSTAYGQRYDGNPLLEMFMGNSETSVAAPAGSDFSISGYAVQLKRWFAASKPAWPHTQLRLCANYFGSDAQMSDLLTTTTAGGGVAVGGPDTTANVPGARTFQANLDFAGATGGSSVVPWVAEVEEIGISYGQYSPAQMYDYASNVMHMSYMVWVYNTYMGDATQKWSTGILPFVRSVNGKVANTTCPKGFASGCNTN